MDLLMIIFLSSTFILNSYNYFRLRRMNGATNRVWTDDLRFTRPSLYQLSYGGMFFHSLGDYMEVRIISNKKFMRENSYIYFWDMTLVFIHLSLVENMTNTPLFL